MSSASISRCIFFKVTQGVLFQATSAISSVQLGPAWAEQAKVAVPSVTEGEDKPLKYPHMFRAGSMMIIR
jgi:hypothetical protein